MRRRRRTPFSNSIFFETERNWTGLLVEADPDGHRRLLTLDRDALVLNACLSPTRRPDRMTFRPAGFFGSLRGILTPSSRKYVESNVNWTKIAKQPSVMVNCFPLNGVLAAV